MRIVAPHDSNVMSVNIPGQMEGGFVSLTLNLLTSTIVAPSNASKWQMGFNSACKGLNIMQSAKKNIVTAKCVAKFVLGCYMLHVWFQ
jgi:hypothetical protein